MYVVRNKVWGCVILTILKLSVSVSFFSLSKCSECSDFCNSQYCSVGHSSNYLSDNWTCHFPADSCSKLSGKFKVEEVDGSMPLSPEWVGFGCMISMKMGTNQILTKCSVLFIS